MTRYPVPGGRERPMGGWTSRESLERDLAREKKRADFWEAQCRAVGVDLKRALEEIKRLGGVPCA